jgi:hypothetical protein
MGIIFSKKTNATVNTVEVNETVLDTETSIHTVVTEPEAVPPMEREFSDVFIADLEQMDRMNCKNVLDDPC